MSYASARDLVAEVVRERLTPREVLPVDVWADRNIRLPPRVTADPGPWQTAKVPYLRRPMRLFGLASVRSLTLMSGSQLAKTALNDCLKGYVIAEAPGPTLVMDADIESAKGYNNDRFLPIIDASPALADKKLPSPQDTQNLKIIFRGCAFWFVGSNSARGRKGRPCRYVFCDEIEDYTDPMWVEVFERVKTYEDAKLVRTSTAGDENSGIDVFYREGSQEHFWVPCPLCGVYQRLVFEGLKWETRAPGCESADEAARATARYECAGCKGRIYNHHKAGMLAGGVWIKDSVAEAEGARVRMAAERALELDADRAPAPAHWSGQISTLYSPFPRATFGDMAEQFVLKGGQMTRDYVRGWLGEPWRVIGERVEESELRALTKHGGYWLRQVPEDVLGLVMTVDVQKDRLFVVVRGWGAYGRGTWLIDRIVLPRVEGRNLVELDELPLVYKTVSGEKTRRVRAEGIDSGDFTHEVYECVRRRRAMGRANVFAMKGGSSGAFGRPHSHTPIDRWPDGTPGGYAGKLIPGGVDLVNFAPDVWKSAIAGRIKGRPDLGEGDEGEGAAKRLPEEMPGFYLPREREPGELAEYIAQVTSEHRALKTDKKGRSNPRRGIEYVWERRPGKVHNHFLDCETQNFALADFLGIRRFGGAAPAKKPAAQNTGTGDWAAGAGTRGGSWKEG